MAHEMFKIFGLSVCYYNRNTKEHREYNIINNACNMKGTKINYDNNIKLGKSLTRQNKISAPRFHVYSHTCIPIGYVPRYIQQRRCRCPHGL